MARQEDVPEIDARLREALGVPEWQPDAGPLEVLIQTILSQHTTSANSRRGYNRLRTQLPSWDQVRDASVEEIASAIATAGLARQKAPRIKRLLQQVSDERADYDLSFLSSVPAEEAMAWLRGLPGVGQTTAACALLFGLNVPVMPVDTAIQRVTWRLGLTERQHADDAQRVLEAATAPQNVYALHVNLIRFGRQICLPSERLCGVCPLNDLCDYFASTRARTRR